MGTTRPIARAATTFNLEHTRLGPLTEFPGTWAGTGFNLIARPDFQDTQPFFLEINGTLENLAFTLIGGSIPNRGSAQDDIFLHGVTYLQQVADCVTHGALHIEPGLWIHIPPTTNPPVPETVVRQGTIPHGDSLLAQSTLITTVATGPTINPVFSVPFTDAAIPGLNDAAKSPITNADYLAQYTNRTLTQCCLLPGLDLNTVVKDPTEILRAAIIGQNIINTVVIVISTAAAAQGSTGILNIPFVVTNAKALQMDAIFWIETVQPTDGEPFLQLQYVQRVILDFPPTPGAGIIHWPHISVATLVKQ